MSSSRNSSFRLELSCIQKDKIIKDLRLEVEHLHKEISGVGLGTSQYGKFDQPRSNSIHFRKQQKIEPDLTSKKHMLNPFLRAQIKLEVGIVKLKEIAHKSNLIVKGTKTIPSTEHGLLQTLSNKITFLESENDMLRRELKNMKKIYEEASCTQKELEHKLEMIAGYFKEYIENSQEEDLLRKKYEVLLGILMSSQHPQMKEFSLAISHEYSKGKQAMNTSVCMNSSEGSINWTDNIRLQKQLDTQTIDSSNNASIGGTSSSDLKKKREKISKYIQRMKKKCDSYLKKLEELEEVETLNRIKDLEENKKLALNILKNVTIVKPEPKKLDVKELISSLNQKQPKAYTKLQENRHELEGFNGEQLSSRHKTTTSKGGHVSHPSGGEHKISCIFFFT